MKKVTIKEFALIINGNEELKSRLGKLDTVSTENDGKTASRITNRIAEVAREYGYELVDDNADIFSSEFGEILSDEMMAHVAGGGGSDDEDGDGYIDVVCRAMAKLFGFNIELCD